MSTERVRVGGRGAAMGQNYNRRDKFRRLATLGSRQNRGDRRGTDGKCVYA